MAWLRWNPRIWSAAALAAVWVATTALAAGAATLHVAVHGADGPACGSKAAPCRTLGQAIANSAPGGKIVVGPGRYGDLDGDGEFLGSGEESLGSPNCMIDVDKALTVLSRDGAAATILDGGSASSGFAANVCLTASGTSFGAPKKGFTLTGSVNHAGLRVGTDDDDVTTTGIVVSGNRSVGNVDGFRISGTANELLGNQAVANTGDGFKVQQPAQVLIANLASDNGGIGFFVFAAAVGTELHDNVSNSNGSYGYIVNAPDVVVDGCVANGNTAVGFNIGQGVAVLTRCAAIGNGGAGVFIGSADSIVDRCTLVGNGTLSQPNCGLESIASGSVEATRVFWGAATGPGADAADDACVTDGPIETLPIATKELRVRPKLPPLD